MKSWALLFAIGLAGCAHPSPQWRADVAGSCEQAGTTLVQLGCPEANPRGITWLEFCRKAQASEGAIDLDVGCIARAENVEAVRVCHVRCRQ